MVEVYNSSIGSFEKMKWKNVKAGAICKIYSDQFFPADMVLLHSSGPKGACYIETKNLDGETNLKIKAPVKELQR